MIHELSCAKSNLINCITLYLNVEFWVIFLSSNIYVRYIERIEGF